MSSSLVATPYPFEAHGTSRQDVLAKLEAQAREYYREVADDVAPFEPPTIRKTGPGRWFGQGRYGIAG